MSIFDLASTLTVEERIEAGHSKIMHNPIYTALSGVLMMGKWEVSDTIPTACTNGRDVIYGREFIDRLNDAQARFIILHEAYHKLYKHLLVYDWMNDIDPVRANAACDYVINQQLVDNHAGELHPFIEMPTDEDGEQMGCLDERFRGMEPVQVFDLLGEDQEQNDGQDGDSGEGGGDQQGATATSGDSTDDTDGTDDADTQGDGDTTTGGGKPDTSGSGGLDQHDWDGAAGLTDEEKEELAEEVDQALRQGALAASKMGIGGEGIDLEELLSAQVDWTEVLREFVMNNVKGNDYASWKRLNRRYVGAGIRMPSGITEQVGELLLLPDTSYSILRHVPVLLAEVVSICKTVSPELVRLLYWGSRVVGDETYTTDELDTLLKTTKPASGGGTCIGPVCDYIRENKIKPQAAIVFTDGEICDGFGNWDCPVLWCILDNKSAKPTIGKVVHINSNALRHAA